MRHDPLPPMTSWLLGLQAGEADREAYVGDVAEEYARRARRGRREAAWWLLEQVVGGGLAWMRYRLPRSSAGRNACAGVLALASTSACLWVLNLSWPLELLRTLPPGARVPAAVGANLLSVACAGIVLAASRPGHGGLLPVMLGTFAWCAAATAGQLVPGFAWALTAATAVAVGHGSVRWTQRRMAGPTG